jgi:hypothetical protein
MMAKWAQAVVLIQSAAAAVPGTNSAYGEYANESSSSSSLRCCALERRFLQAAY